MAVEVLGDAARRMRELADDESKRSDIYFAGSPGAREDKTPEAEQHSGHIYARLSEVHGRAADQLDELALRVKRDEVRSSNPYWAKLSDEAVDKILIQYKMADEEIRGRYSGR